MSVRSLAWTTVNVQNIVIVTIIFQNDTGEKEFSLGLVFDSVDNFFVGVTCVVSAEVQACYSAQPRLCNNCFSICTHRKRGRVLAIAWPSGTGTLRIASWHLRRRGWSKVLIIKGQCKGNCAFHSLSIGKTSTFPVL